MKNHRLTQPIRAILAFALIAIILPAVSVHAAAVKVLQFTATVSNVTGASIILDHPDLNGKPTLKLIVNQWFTTTYNNHPVGVTYNPATPASMGRWTIFNEDLATMPVGASFNVLVASTSTKDNATILNSVDNITGIGTASGKPSAFLYFTHLLNPDPALLGGVFVPKNQGMEYLGGYNPHSSLHDKWCIFNQDQTSALVATYFVFDATKLPNNLVHTATGANSLLDETKITDGGAINTAAAVVFFTPLGPEMNDHALGVGFDGGEWVIFSEDDASAITPNQQFNVLFFPGPTP